MTHVDPFVGEEEGSSGREDASLESEKASQGKETAASAPKGNKQAHVASTTKASSASNNNNNENAPSPDVKTIKVYQNGNTAQLVQPLVVQLRKKSQSWSELLHVLHDTVQTPVHKVFTVSGKRVMSWSEVEKLDELVVCGSSGESFRLLPYGKRVSSKSCKKDPNNSISTLSLPPCATPTPPSDVSDKSQIKAKSNNKCAAVKQRGKRITSNRANLVKSVIVESSTSATTAPAPPVLRGVESTDRGSNGIQSNPNPHFLTKTLSEQDVSRMEMEMSTPRTRARGCQSTHGRERPRPISAYQHQVTLSMSSSADRKSLAVSRIPVPKRACGTPLGLGLLTSHVSSQSNCSGTPTIGSTSNSLGSNGMTASTIGPNTQVRARRNLDKAIPVAPESTTSTTRDDSRNEFVRPRLVTIIRHGMKPRKAVRFLLNKKIARSYDQVLNELTESVKPDWGAVRKVYTLTGNEVACLEDFFGEDDIFLACPNDRIGTNDFDLDSEECKSIQPYVKASLGLRPNRFKGLEPPRSPSRRPRSGTHSQNNNHSAPFPTFSKYMSLAHFPAAILERYYVGNLIGDGNFAVVRECTDRVSQKRFALKVIDKDKCKGRDAPPEHEVKILGMVNHPNVVKMFEQFDFSNELYIVMELLEGGDLFDAIAAVTKFSEEESASMTQDIASALAFLHTLNIVHRDIKPENLLVHNESSGKRRIKLGDFGLAKIYHGPLYTVCGTPTYVAPEILAESGYGMKVDIWALGVILYVLLCGYPPFVSPTGDQEQLFDLILTAEYCFPEENWDSISEDAKDLIRSMIETDVDDRLSAKEVLTHPWLCGNDEPKENEICTNRRQDNFSFRIFQEMGLSSLMSLPP